MRTTHSLARTARLTFLLLAFAVTAAVASAPAVEASGVINSGGRR
jgi:hypothetical protein